ncbi:MAG: flagellar protein FliT [Sarcina sp.]
MENLIIEYIKFGDLALKELEKEDFEKLEEFLEEREELFKKIVEANNEKISLKEIMEKHNLLEKEKQLVEKLDERKKEVRESLNNLRKTKAMNNQYRNASGKLSFLNRQI